MLGNFLRYKRKIKKYRKLPITPFNTSDKQKLLNVIFQKKIKSKNSQLKLLIMPEMTFFRLRS